MELILDIVIASVVLWSTFTGLRVGLIMSAASFFGLIAAAILSSQHLESVYIQAVRFLKIDTFPLDVKENYYIYVTSYLIMMSAIYLCIYFVAMVLRALFGTLMLGWVDSVFGAIFGFVKGVIVSVFLLSVLVFLGRYSPAIRLAVDRSKASEILPDISSVLFQLLPKDIQSTVNGYIS